MAISSNQHAIAKRRAKERATHFPHAVSAEFEPTQRFLKIELSSRAFLCIHDFDLQGLAGVDARDLQDVRILGDGYGIYFPAIDQSFHLPSLLEGFLGTRQWTAQMARKGGQSTSAAKKSAAQANGRLGGRPKKKLEGHA